MTNAQVDLTGLDEPARIEAFRVSANLFSTMGLSPLIGRGFSPQEDSPAGEPVAILGHGSWERRFGADRGIVGRQIVLDGKPNHRGGCHAAQARTGFVSRRRDLDSTRHG